MKLKMLAVIGAVAPSFILCAPAVAAEFHSGMVIAQMGASGDKPPDKDHKVPDKDQKPAQHPGGPPKPAVQQQQQIKQPQQPAQVQKPVIPAEKPAIQKPAQQQQLQKPVQLPAQQDLKKLPPPQQSGGGNQHPAQVQKPVQLPGQPPQQSGGNQQNPAQVQKPVIQNPALDKNRVQQPTVQTQQSPALAPGKQRLDQVRGDRRETHEGNRTVIHEQNRTIIREGGQTIIRHDDIDRFRMGARNVQVEQRGNETVTIVVQPDGDRIITITDGNGRLLQRLRRLPNGQEIVLIDNRHRGPQSGFGFLADLAAPIIHIPRDRYIVDADRADSALLYETLIAPPVMLIERPYSLDEIRYTHALRERMPRIDLDTITFDIGSWEVTPEQARLLEPIADAMLRAIKRNPNEIYMIEGHTDLVGSDIDNLSLSDRRAEAVAEILTQDFGIPPENLTTQGYGEEYPKVATQGPERRNRRVTVRRITPLLMGRN